MKIFRPVRAPHTLLLERLLPVFAANCSTLGTFLRRGGAELLLTCYAATSQGMFKKSHLTSVRRPVKTIANPPSYLLNCPALASQTLANCSTFETLGVGGAMFLRVQSLTSHSY